MNPWVDLYSSQNALRTGSSDIDKAIRTRLIRLAGMGCCSASIEGRFTYRKAGGRCREWYIRPEAEDSLAEPLTIPGLTEAALSVQLTANSTQSHLHEFSASISGKTEAGALWTVAVHLVDDRDQVFEPGLLPDQKGAGACSHAVLHCHVGPGLKTPPEVRVPLAPVRAEDALDWLLTTVLPSWEPMPWKRLNVLLDEEGS
jgi:hypothetical protein